MLENFSRLGLTFYKSRKMKPETSLSQPWMTWYAANESPVKPTHYVVPYMAAGNAAAVNSSAERLDLSKPKSFASSKD